MTTTPALDLLEKQAREKLQWLRDINDMSDGGGRMMKIGQYEDEQRQMKEARRTLDLIAVARLEMGSSGAQTAPSTHD